eukprot:scaffold3808_cov222-Pinguiococcus_pyrenoidosus.AAC.1
MEALVDEGRIRSLGVSNFRVSDLQRLLGFARIPPVVNQVEGHPQLLQPRLRDFCSSSGIQIMSYSPLVSISEDWLLQSVDAIARRLDTTPAAVLLAWALRTDSGFVTTSRRSERIAEALSSFEVAPKLSDDDVKFISQVGSERPASLPALQVFFGPAGRQPPAAFHCLSSVFLSLLNLQGPTPDPSLSGAVQHFLQHKDFVRPRRVAGALPREVAFPP